MLVAVIGGGVQLLTLSEHDPDYARLPEQLLNAPPFIMAQPRTQLHVTYTHKVVLLSFLFSTTELLENATAV